MRKLTTSAVALLLLIALGAAYAAAAGPTVTKVTFYNHKTLGDSNNPLANEIRVVHPNATFEEKDGTLNVGVEFEGPAGKLCELAVLSDCPVNTIVSYQDGLPAVTNGPKFRKFLEAALVEWTKLRHPLVTPTGHVYKDHPDNRKEVILQK